MDAWMDGRWGDDEWNSGRRVSGMAEARAERTRVWGWARTLWGSAWEQWGRGGCPQTVNLRSRRRALSTAWAQGIVADKVRSGGSGAWQDVGGTAAGPRGR